MSKLPVKGVPAAPVPAVPVLAIVRKARGVALGVQKCYAGWDKGLRAKRGV